MVALRSSSALVDELERIASALDMLDVTLGPDLEDARDRLARRIRTYLLPRLRGEQTALAVVFAGPTGSGKSTLVNSLSRVEVSRTGPVRPTTRRPVILTSGDQGSALAGLGGVDCDVVTGQAPILDHMALVDTPDIDSTARDHREMAERLIDDADVVVFVTSALRYADLVPWQVLRRAASRGAPIIFVLNRVTGDTGAAYADFRRRLASAGFDPDVLRVPEHHLEPGAQTIPTLAVRELQRRLAAVARDREESGREILERVLESTVMAVSDLIDEVDDRHALRHLEAEEVRSAFKGRLDHLWASVPTIPLPVGGPPPRGWLRRRLWLRANRIEQSVADRHSGESLTALAVRVQTDLGRIGAAIDATVTGSLVPATRPVLEDALTGWMIHSRGSLRGIRERRRPLAEIALISAVLGDSGVEILETVGLDEADQAIESARTGLRERLEVVYGLAADLSVRSTVGDA